MNQVIRDIQAEYIKKYVRLDNNFTEKYGVWKSISIIDRGIEKWWDLISTTIERGAYFLVSFCFTLYMLLNANSWYVVIFIALFLCMIIISTYFNNLCLKYRKLRNESKNLFTKQLVKILMSKNEIFQSNKVETETKILDGYLQDNTRYNKQMGTPIFGLFWIPSAIILIFLISTFYFLGNEVLDGNMRLSELVWITGSIIIIQKSIDIFLEFYKNITKEFVVVQNLWDFFDHTPEIEWYDEWTDFEWKNGNFHIKNLTYAYNESKKIFQNFNLEIEWQKILAIVGNSGWGKTTLMKLLAGYIRQDAGDIIIDDQNLREVSLKSYYQNIWYLTQEPSVFDGTVFENLTYWITNVGNEYFHSDSIDDTKGNENIHSLQEKIQQVIKDAKCEFIYELPDGLQTEIWERGVKLSGWQRQRLAIAKIMLKNPKIIFLDEPTSALDSFSEEQITKAMNNLFAGRTVIIVAHRLQTVKHAHRIIVLEEGKILEEWTHDTLIEKNGIYKKMLELQSWF